jgi:predicted PhzF superfamily epimerase YddE/YHI9
VVGGERLRVLLENEPGYELGRPNGLGLEVARKDATISRVWVGGCVVQVIDGTVCV